jgi:acetyl-CoA C-acetyltransferase
VAPWVGDPVVVAALRSPIGTAGRSLAGVDAAALAAPVLSALTRQVPLPVREVMLGNCMGPGGDVARVAALAAGLPVTVPALTVDRQCASGLAAVVTACRAAAAEPGLYVAGGVESASTAPWRFWPPGREAEASGAEAAEGADGAALGTGPVRYHRAPFAPAEIGDPEMGLANDVLAEEAGIARADQDRYAARSHARAVRTAGSGGFAEEVVPVAGVSVDERPRALTVERLARLPAAFRDGGTVTAGNSCGVNDGAAAVAVVDADTHRSLGVPGLRVLAHATVAYDPNRPGWGLVPATREVLDRAGLGTADVDVLELNEAFAGQVLACCAELGVDPERVCPEGGALALGHPWGASGTVLVVRLYTQLVRRRRGRFGLAAIAAGGGQAVAVLVESVPGRESAP